MSELKLTDDEVFEQDKILLTFLQAKYAYMNAMRCTHIRRFVEWTQGKKLKPSLLSGEDAAQLQQEKEKWNSEEERLEFGSIYKDLALHHHPDKGGDEQLFKEIQHFKEHKDLPGLRQWVREHETVHQLPSSRQQEVKDAITTLQQKINAVENTAYWQWNEGTDTIKELVQNMYVPA